LFNFIVEAQPLLDFLRLTITIIIIITKILRIIKTRSMMMTIKQKTIYLYNHHHRNVDHQDMIIESEASLSS